MFFFYFNPKGYNPTSSPASFPHRSRMSTITSCEFVENAVRLRLEYRFSSISMNKRKNLFTFSKLVNVDIFFWRDEICQFWHVIFFILNDAATGKILPVRMRLEIWFLTCSKSACGNVVKRAVISIPNDEHHETYSHIRPITSTKSNQTILITCQTCQFCSDTNLSKSTQKNMSTFFSWFSADFFLPNEIDKNGNSNHTRTAKKTCRLN